MMKLFKKILNTFLVLFNKRKILFWYEGNDTNKNFGDAINPFLFQTVVHEQIVHYKNVFNVINRPVYYFIGSILNGLNNKNSVICGSGFLTPDAKIKKKPKKVIAVRGPLSREIFLKYQVKCPEVYCDPALLLPYYIKKPTHVKYFDVGIVAHYIDKNILYNLFIDNYDLTFKFIDVESDRESFISELTSCKYIFSSSLHGIIVAHAYEIPTVWIKLSNNVIGDNFKFNDYALSTGNKNMKVINIDKKIDLKKLINESFLYDIKLNQKSLLNAMIKEFDIK